MTNVEEGRVSLNDGVREQLRPLKEMGVLK
jgi:hypothetical protein